MAELEADRKAKAAAVEAATASAKTGLTHQATAAKVRHSRDSLTRGAATIAAVIGFFAAAVPTAAYFISIGDDRLVQKDPSILPGKVLPIIPGVPDFNGGDLTFQTQISNGQVTVTSQVPESKQATSGNTASNNFALVQGEHDLNRQAARIIISYTRQNHGIISRVVSHGEASDELIGGPAAGIQVADPKNEALSEIRAEAGQVDFQAVAKEEGVSIPKISVTGQEVILTKDQAHQLDAAAHGIKLSRAELTYDYNHDRKKLSKYPKVLQLLNTLLGAHRSVSYDVVIDLPKQNVESNPIDKLEKYHYKGIPGEIIPLAAGIWGGIFGFALGAEHVGIRLARRRAQFKVHRLRRKADKA